MTIPASFLGHVLRDPSRILLSVPQKDRDELYWTAYTRAEIHEQVAGMVVRLYALGVKAGTRVAICGHTSAEWMLLDLAVLSLRGVVVGIYPTLTPKEVSAQLDDCSAEIIFIEDDQMLEKLDEVLDESESLIHVFSMSPSVKAPQILPAKADFEFLKKKIAEVQDNDIATLVYTSGTTGPSKGVVLKHKHIMSTLFATQTSFPMFAGDRSIVYLPMAHILQRIVSYRALIDDVEGTISPSIEALPHCLKATRPHVLVVVPRVLEKIVLTAGQKAESAGVAAYGVFRWAMRVAESVGLSEKPLSRRLKIQQRIAQRLVYSKIQSALGGHLRTILSGAAPLSPTVAAQFIGMGFHISEGWGLSESSGPATISQAEGYRLGSVGMPIRCVSVRVSEIGELELKGESVFESYWNNPEETQAAFTSDGWFRTGDMGRLDKAGRIWITGRSKDIIITSGGKNIAPQPIESRLIGGIIEYAVLIGDRRPYVVALIQGFDQNDANVHDMENEIQKKIDELNQQLPSFAQIKKWALLSENLSLENGTLTPTLKVKRTLVHERFKGQIDELYLQ